MAKSRMINTKIWEDAWFNDLDPIEKLFFVYLLTNPMTNILGVYELSKGTMGRATGLESRVVEEMLSRFEKSGKVYFRDGWVVISNFIKHQNYKSPKILAGLDAELKNVPDNIKIFINSPIKLYGIDTISHLNSNSNSNSNIKSEVSDAPKIVKFTEKDVEMVSLLTSLIQRNNPGWQMRGSPDKWAEDMNKINRIDNRTYEQIEFMIKWTQKDPFWSQNILSASKLREKFNDLIPKLKKLKTNSTPNYVL